jgi:hypothetical protein
MSIKTRLRSQPNLMFPQAMGFLVKDYSEGKKDAKAAI